MKKFLLGIVAGFIIAGVTAVVLFFAALKFARRAPEPPEAAWLTLRLGGELPELQPLMLPLPALESRAPLTMGEVWSALRRAARDPRVKGVLIKPGGLAVGWAKLEEIRTGLEQVRKAGKPVHAWLAGAGTREYYLASAADRISMSPEDVLDLRGLRVEATYLKGTLDKLGVQVEVEHAGKYKDAGDMFTRNEMSPETREALNALLDDTFERLCQAIAAGRKATPEKAREWIDNGPYVAPKAVQAGLVDELAYERDADRKFEESAGGKEKEKPKALNARDYLRIPPDTKGRKVRQVALLVAQGSILRAAPGDMFGEEQVITPKGIEQQVKLIENDPAIRGVIVRIDSPGGDAVASDEILEQLKRLSKKKTVVFSMSDVAASGGYYMAMTGDPIIAYPGTITGSIGVIYGKANLRGLYAKLGMNREILKRGRFADLDSTFQPLTPEGRARLRETIDFIYDGFLKRVAEGRRKKREEIEPVAQGRVWSGKRARELGLVDETGGLDEAVALLRKKAAIPEEELIRLSVYPAPKSWFDVWFKPSPAEDSGWDGEEMLLRRALPAGLAPWLQGGFLRVLPFDIRIH
ncbi:MAG: signal peptide peptidase SppA [Bryobacteraceae bacterium]|nr:signal peptide peptidase SppA [Bryobacteraceae bacterium]